jgi:hypothetical protein
MIITAMSMNADTPAPAAVRPNASTTVSPVTTVPVGPSCTTPLNLRVDVDAFVLVTAMRGEALAEVVVKRRSGDRRAVDQVSTRVDCRWSARHRPMDAGGRLGAGGPARAVTAHARWSEFAGFDVSFPVVHVGAMVGGIALAFFVVAGSLMVAQTPVWRRSEHPATSTRS